ncbi:MAG: AAA family ATPase, partial [Bacteroidia bacterium]
MSAAKKTTAIEAPSTPLVNLFGYLRDLFQTSQPSLDFTYEAGYRKSRHRDWWELSLLQQLAQNENPALQLQFEQSEQALLVLHRTSPATPPKLPEQLEGWVNIETDSSGVPSVTALAEASCSFTADPERMRIYREFAGRVDGKPLEEVQNLKVPKILDGWVNFQQRNERLQVQPNNQAMEKFTTLPLREELRIAYQRALRKHHQEHGNASALIQLYDGLHALYYDLKAHPDRRLSLSFGLLTGGSGEHAYRNFLFHVPLQLKLEKQTIRLEMGSIGSAISCEQSFAALLPEWFPEEREEVIRERQQTVLREVDQFNQQSLDFQLDPKYLGPTYHATALRILSVFPQVYDGFFAGRELNFAFPEGGQKEGVELHFAPVIQVRQQEDGMHISRDAANIIEKIHALGSEGRNDEIPDYFKRLFALRSPGSPLRIAYRKEAFSVQSASSVSEPVPERFLFPLPYNQEQLTIAKRLLEQDTVIVKGPPGTGKSHTIANLTSHFVAQGKSILIVSKYAKALQVIKGKLPAPIRDLAVSLVEEGTELNDLKFAIDAIKDHLSQQYDPEQLAEMQSMLANKDQALKQLQIEIEHLIAQNAASYSLTDPTTGTNIEQTAIEWVKAWQEEQSDLRFPDNIGADIEIPALLNEIAELQALIPELDTSLSDFDWPEVEALPSLAEIEKWQGILSQQTETNTLDPSLLDEAFLHQLQAYRPVLEAWPHFAKWQRQVVLSPDRLYTLYKQWEHEVQQAELAREKMLAYQFSGEILETQEPEYLAQQVATLLAKFGTKDRLSVLQRKLLSTPHKALLQCQLNGIRIEDKSSLKTLSLYLEQESRLKQLSIQLHNALRPLDINVDRQNLWQVLNEIQQFLSLRTQMTHLNEMLRERNITEIPTHYEDWEPIWERLTQLSDQKSQIAQRDEYEAILAAIPRVQTPSPLWQDMLTALQNTYAIVYDTAIQSYEAAKQKAEQNSVVQARLQAFQTQYPESRRLLDDDTIDWAKTIFRRELDDLIAACLKEIGETDEKLDQLRLLQKDIEKLIIELIAYQTWMNKQAHISEDQKSALSAWRNDLINIGKGYGKNTARNLDSAIQNLKKAREVVPIWIMPQDTAIRFFPEADPGQFDLLIVDEASQCDISMLNLIFRARKSIIVGDENQTSVVTNASMFPMERTNQILDRYLINHPFKQQFHLNSRTASIYTLSGVIYPNIVSLREHFRCRPEIINYSNRNMYNEQMVPLKTATHDLFGKPVEAHYVEDDPSDRSKPALVRAAVELIEGVVADFKAGHLPYLPSVGLLCMETSNEDFRDG